jgi:hypothetical protein
MKTLLGRYLAVRADVEAVAALDRGDKGAAAARPGMPGVPGMPEEVTPL